MEQYMDTKELIKHTLEELKKAKQRLIKNKSKIPHELNRRINLYGGGFISPRSFEKEIRDIITSEVYEKRDFKYNPGLGKFTNAAGEIADMKTAVRVNDENDKARKELGFQIPTDRKKQKQIAINIALGRKLELVEEQLELPFTPKPEPKPFIPKPVTVDERSIDEIINERIQIKNNTTGLAALIGKKII